MHCEGYKVYPGCAQSPSLTIVMMVGLLVFGPLRTCLGSRCVSNCNSKPVGNYQACNTCTKFVSCSGLGFQLMDCAAGTVYDDDIKNCNFVSGTCPEPTTTTTTTTPQTTTTPMPTTTSEQTTTSFDQMTTAQADMSTSSITDISGTSPSVITSSDVMTTSGTALSPLTHTTSQSALSSTMTSTDISESTTLDQSNSTTIGYCGTGKCYTKVTFNGGFCTGSPSILETRFARSRLQCGSLCAAHQQCWFFSISGGQCTLYSGTTPPCGEVYQYRI